MSAANVASTEESEPISIGGKRAFKTRKNVITGLTIENNSIVERKHTPDLRLSASKNWPQTSTLLGLKVGSDSVAGDKLTITASNSNFGDLI